MVGGKWKKVFNDQASENKNKNEELFIYII